MADRRHPEGEESGAGRGKDTLQIVGKLFKERDEAEAKRDEAQYRNLKLTMGIVLAVVLILGGVVGVYLGIKGPAGVHIESTTTGESP